MIKMWNDLVRTALIGTDKATPSVETLQQLEKWGINTADIPDALLTGAGTYAVLRKSSFTPTTHQNPLPSRAKQEEQPYCSGQAARYLIEIIRTENNDLLLEFFWHLHKKNKRLPPESLPILLHKCRGNEMLWEMISPFVGERGWWLAQQNSAWSHLTQKPADTNWLNDYAIWDSQMTLLEAKDLMDTLRSTRHVWQNDLDVAAKMALLGIKAQPTLSQHLTLFFQEDLPYFWQEKLRQMLSMIHFRKNMIDNI
jgi:hypothetical protein